MLSLPGVTSPRKESGNFFDQIQFPFKNIIGLRWRGPRACAGFAAQKRLLVSLGCCTAGFGSGGFLATSPTDCHGTHWGPAVLANTGGRRGQEGRLCVTGRACLLPCPAQHHGRSWSRPTWHSHPAARQNQGNSAREGTSRVPARGGSMPWHAPARGVCSAEQQLVQLRGLPSPSPNSPN